MSASYDVVEVYVCPTCDESFETPGGPVYTCSRCGSSEVVEEGERGRCSSCNVFMAKDAAQSCPECEEPLEDGLEPVERIQTPDGETHATMAAARRWVRSAPKRAQVDAENAARTRALLDEHRIAGARRREHRREVVGRWKPIAYYGGRNDDSMFWDSSTVSVTPDELMDLTGTDDVIEALRAATVHQDAYLAAEDPKQAWVLPGLDHLEYDDDGHERQLLRRQTQFTFDFEIFERMVNERVGYTPKV